MEGDGLFGTGATGEVPYRATMEEAFGQDFSGVRVQLGQRGELASIGAQAATSGQQIAFADAAPDRYTVAHELAHVVQHRRHGDGAGGISHPDDAAEHEADRIAEQVVAGQLASAPQHPAVTGETRPSAASNDDAVPPDAELEALEPEGIDLDAAAQRPVERASDAAAIGGAGAAAIEPTTTAEPEADPESALKITSDGLAGAPKAAGNVPKNDPAIASKTTGNDLKATGNDVTAASHGPKATENDATATSHDAKATPDAEPGRARPAALDPSPASPVAALTGVKLSQLDQTLRQVTASLAAPSPPPPPVPLAAPVLAPRDPAAGPAAATPRSAPPSVARSPAPARSVLTHQAPAAPAPPARDAITAGPRPRVEPTGPADPAHAATAASTGRDRLDARLASSVATTARDLGAATLDTPVAPRAAPPRPAPAPAPPPIAAPAIPEAPWRLLAPAARARLDDAVAPALERRVATLTARTEADAAQTQAQLAQLETAHRADVAAATARAQAETAALRGAGTARIDAVRGQWQARTTAVRDQTVAQIAAEHAAAEAEIQTTVHAGEARSDAILTGAERDAEATRRGAEASAQAILAAAGARAAAARAQGASVATSRSVARREIPEDDAPAVAAGGEDEARRILEEAQAEVERAIARAEQEIARLVANASSLSEEEIEQRLLLITSRIGQLRASLAQKVDEALGDRFPELEAAYLGQIDFLLDDIRGNMFSVADALFEGNAALAASQLETARGLIDARVERLNMTLEDAAVLSTFDDIDTALEAFNIEMVDAGGGAWTDAQRQAALGQAIRIENAFRAADRDGMFAEAGLTEPGAAFAAIMNGGNGVKLEMVGPAGGKGAETMGAGRIEFYTLSSRSEGLADGLQFHFGHEFGHAFNAAMVNADNALDGDTRDAPSSPYSIGKNGDLDRETIGYTSDGHFVPVAGAGVERFVLKQELDEVAAAAQENAGDAWATMTTAQREAAKLAEAQKRSVAQGMQMSADSLRQSPYQQNPTNSSGEWFADMFVNWANGTLADGPAGDAIDAWMDDHAEDWLRMRLEADGMLPPPTPPGPAPEPN